MCTLQKFFVPLQAELDARHADTEDWDQNYEVR